MQRMQTASLFDHLAGAREQRRLNNKVECRMRLSIFECKIEIPPRGGLSEIRPCVLIGRREQLMEIRESDLLTLLPGH
jgi:hypothetical protein